MKKSILSIITVAALSVGIAGNASAEEITVKTGDTLWDIAEQKEVSVEELQEWNDLTDDLIHPEDKLTIQEYYEILKGDSLWDIAQAHNLSIHDLKEWNNINSHIIQPGDMLIIDHKDKGKETSSSIAAVKKQEKTTEVEEASSKPAEVPAKKEVTAKTTEPAETSTEKEVTVKTTEPAETSTEKEVTVKTTEPTETSTEKVLTVEATAYTANCEGCSGTTKTGIDLHANPDKKVIAVDPDVIPLGSTVHVEGYGEAIAGDIGGGINGNEIDVFIPSESNAKKWGRKEVQVKILD
ncbi:LysM peptidoglycan-binding and 3D domain-containing protein [Metabacillus litoralis]|uniref:LysM peptidoglycan-binding and 3D domain-containing protein n=1 Tax=Metabacillus litoralis TaxID=152268 RepID=UPI00203EC0BD|nr:LysM peptidoglycan-binding and 3D domain-containing protein [Metabacillus litoralis]MCM3651687.1 LysM peptidoglycan-binding domain-containing protein [Metabacillus litoralis]